MPSGTPPSPTSRASLASTLVLGSLLAGLAIAFPPAEATLTGLNPVDEAAAATAFSTGPAGFLLPGSFWSSYAGEPYVQPPEPSAAVSTTPITAEFGMPGPGGSFLILSTGNALEAPSGTQAPEASSRFLNTYRGGYDATFLGVRFNQPAGCSGIEFTFQFLSEEYPTWVGDPYDDGFIAEVDTGTWSVHPQTGARIAPNNFAFDGGTTPVTVNSARWDPAAAVGSVYNAGTLRRTAATDVAPGIHRLYVGVYDASDRKLDSAVLLADFHPTTSTGERCTPCAMTGRASLAHLRVEDPRGTGTVQPVDTWVQDTGDVWTKSSEHHWTGVASLAGPVVAGDAVASSVDTFANPACRSEARASAAHLDHAAGMPVAAAPFRLRAAEAWSTSSCSAGSQGGTTLAYLMVGGTVLVDTVGTPTPNTVYFVGPVKVTLNEQVAGPGVLEVNVVRLELPGAFDLKVLSARSDIHDCAGTTPQTPPPSCGPPAGLEPARIITNSLLCQDPCTGTTVSIAVGPVGVSTPPVTCDPCSTVDCTPTCGELLPGGCGLPCGTTERCVDWLCEGVLPGCTITVGPCLPVAGCPPDCASAIAWSALLDNDCAQAWCSFIQTALYGNDNGCYDDDQPYCGGAVNPCVPTCGLTNPSPGHVNGFAFLGECATDWCWYASSLVGSGWVVCAVDGSASEGR